mgnify:FL=1
MNRHALIDRLTVILASIFAGRNKFFSRSMESPSLEDLLENISIPLRSLRNGITEFSVEAPAGETGPALYVHRFIDCRHPTVIYHHGSGEKPFDFGRLSKNTFRDIFMRSDEFHDINLISLRAPFHDGGSRHYARKMTRLSNFTAMLCVSTVIVQSLVKLLHEEGCGNVTVCGTSLGGWVTTLHKAYMDSADTYIPIMAGASLDDLFIGSSYSRLTGRRALEDPEKLKAVLDYSEKLSERDLSSVFPLLALHDQYIRYDVQRPCYGERYVTDLDKGHVTALLAVDDIRAHILSVLKT